MPGADRLAALRGSLSPDMQLAIAYTPRAIRAQVMVLLAYDRALGIAVSRASQPLLGQIRLAWWRDLLGGGGQENIADPVADGVVSLASDDALRVAMLAMVNGWEKVLEELPIGDDVLLDYAEGRGGGLFTAVARLAGHREETGQGRTWALADFAFHCSDPDTATCALSLCERRSGDRLPRPLSLLERFARRDVRRGLARGSAEGRPSRIWDAVCGALTGR